MGKKLPKLCVLTQTAYDVSDYYKTLFGNFDLFFITYKRKNKNAVDFMPNSTWSDGRNCLWNHVKGNYEYYLFIDDDLEFFGMPNWSPMYVEWVLYSLRLRLGKKYNYLDQKGLTFYKKIVSEEFSKILYKSLEVFNPMVASFRDLFSRRAVELDLHAMRQNQKVRPAGWFDAQTTIFSQLAAELLLPYDTSFSGWWSSQIPIYSLSHLAFEEKSLCMLDIGIRNSNHNVYRAGYDGHKDCLKMAEWLSAGFLCEEENQLLIESTNMVNRNYAEKFCREKTISQLSVSSDNNISDVLLNLQEKFSLKHPYLFQRHEDLIKELEVGSLLSV